MGIIIKQSIKSTAYSYIGAAIGFVNASLLMPMLLSTEEIGLINYIISIALILSQLSGLGLGTLINRIFPYFRNSDKKNNGFFTLGFVISIVGSALSILLYFLLKAQFLKGETDSIELENYIFYVLPLTIVFIFLNFFDNYLKALFNSTIGVFLKEIITRLLITITIIFYFFQWIELDTFVLTFFLSYSIPVFIFAIVLMRQGHFTLIRPRRFLLKKLNKAMFSISFFGIIVGFSSIAILNIDKYMIERFVGLSGVGIYAITFYFATMILLPARAIQKIATIILSESWKNNDIENIKLIYFKSTITQLIIGAYIFIGLWANIDNIIKIIGPDFEPGRYVIFFIGITNVITMLSGVNQSIIATSKKYIYSSVFMIIMLVFIIVSNLIFIPIYGIVGAAFASFASMTIVSLLRYIFVWKAFGLQPYNFKHLLILAIVGLSYLSVAFIPDLQNPFFDIIIKGTIISFLFGLMIYFSKVSEDINEKAEQIYRRFIKR